MEFIWVLLVGGIAIALFYYYFSINQQIKEDKFKRDLLDSYTEKAKREHPEIVGHRWIRKRELVDKGLRPRILSRTSGRCFYCDRLLTHDFGWQVDHVWPYRYGGSEELINLVPACRECNKEKWSHLPPRYLLHKWVIGEKFTGHELRLLKYYETNSMANLIGTSTFWKGKADYWKVTVFPDFVDLVTQNKCLKNTAGKERDDLIKRAQNIYNLLNCDIVFKYNGDKYMQIKKWLETDNH
jgi:5-methylcytosine-specific restriction endonuclease McrA